MKKSSSGSSIQNTQKMETLQSIHSEEAQIPINNNFRMNYDSNTIEFDWNLHLFQSLKIILKSYITTEHSCSDISIEFYGHSKYHKECNCFIIFLCYYTKTLSISTALHVKNKMHVHVIRLQYKCYNNIIQKLKNYSLSIRINRFFTAFIFTGV